MRTSLNEIREAERFLKNEMSTEEAIVFEARMIIHPPLQRNVGALRTLMHILRFYHRKKIKKELQALHTMLLKSPERSNFQQVVREIFHH